MVWTLQKGEGFEGSEIAIMLPKVGESFIHLGEFCRSSRRILSFISANSFVNQVESTSHRRLFASEEGVHPAIALKQVHNNNNNNSIQR